MNGMKNSKQIIIIALSAILLGAIIFLTYTFTSGNSVGLFNLRASNPQDEVDTFLADNNLAPTSLPPADGDTDESLLAYNSTSPSPTPPATDAVSGSPTPTPFEANQGVDEGLSPTPTGGTTKGGLELTPTITPTMSLTPTPSPTEFIEITGEMSPTVVTELPVAGIADNLGPVLLGGGALILLAFLL